MSESGAREPLPGDGRPALDGSKKTGEEMSEPGVREPQPGDGRPAIDGSKKTGEESVQLQWETVDSSGIPSWRKDLLPEDENPDSPDCIPPIPTRPNISLLDYIKEFEHETHQPPKMDINVANKEEILENNNLADSDEIVLNSASCIVRTTKKGVEESKKAREEEEREDARKEEEGEDAMEEDKREDVREGLKLLEELLEEETVTTEEEWSGEWEFEEMTEFEWEEMPISSRTRSMTRQYSG